MAGVPTRTVLALPAAKLKVPAFAVAFSAVISNPCRPLADAVTDKVRLYSVPGVYVVPLIPEKVTLADWVVRVVALWHPLHVLAVAPLPSNGECVSLVSFDLIVVCA